MLDGVPRTLGRPLTASLASATRRATLAGRRRSTPCLASTAMRYRSHDGCVSRGWCSAEQPASQVLSDAWNRMEARGGGWSGERPGESWAVLSASMAASAKVVAVASSFGCTLLPVSAEARVPDTQNLVEMWVCASRHCIYLVACTVDLL